MRKTYSQYCPVAHALDLVGERWALLVVRELLGGPKRYTDLAEALPGIGTNILAGRLRDLESGGIVRKRKLPPPAASTVYELTEYGAELREVLSVLGRWGARSLGPPCVDDILPAGWASHAARSLFDPEAARGVTAEYELRADGELVAIRVEDGELDVRASAADDPQLVLETDPATLLELVSGDLSPAEAVASGRARVDGDAAELDRFVALFGRAARAAA